MKICAFDLSLTGTGWARNYGVSPTCVQEYGLIAPDKLTGILRLTYIRNEVLCLCGAPASSLRPLVIMEDIAFSRNDPSAQERAGLAYLIRVAMWERQQKYVLVAPTTLKKFVSGKGNSPKQVMLLEVYKRWMVSLTDDNVADAFGLLQIGRSLTGLMQPETKAQQEVLDVLRKKNEWLLSLCS